MDEELLKEKVLLVVDDEVDLRDIVASELEFMGAKVFQAENIAVAQKILCENKIDLIVSDIRMPGGTGIDLLDIVKARNSNNLPVVLITGFADITVEDAFHKGAEALVNKPFLLDDLMKMIVRYTSVFENRFKEEVLPQKNITSTHVKLGRGGFVTEVSTEAKRYDVGEVMSFDIDFKGQKFQGKGICRWLKPMTTPAHRSLMGIEFMNLTEASIVQFKKIYESEKLIPYIPSKP